MMTLIAVIVGCVLFIEVWRWIYWFATQLVQAVFYVVGILTLWLPCLCHAWEPGPKSMKDGRDIDQWSWRSFRWLGLGNREDGVSGQTAKLIGGGPYMPYDDSRRSVVYADNWKYRLWLKIKRWLYDAWRAYRWSAIRNSADDWKYWLRWPFKQKAPYKEWKTPWGKTMKFGFQNENGILVPVF